MIERQQELAILKSMLRRHPVVGILGARQVGKTTLARMLAGSLKQQIHWFDLENPEDLARLTEPMLVLQRLKGLVVIDEIQGIRTSFRSCASWRTNAGDPVAF